MNQLNLKRTTLGLAAALLLTFASITDAEDAAATTNQVAQTAATNGPPTTGSGTVIGSRPKESFWRRLDEAYREQLGAPAYTEPAPPEPGAPAPPSTRRGLPAPFDSPPYPTGEWQIGGTPIIGDQNLTPDPPLMQALYQGPHGQAWADSKIKIYGWTDVSGNLSTSEKSGVGANGQSANFPVVYAQRPNRFEMDQTVLYVERTTDENQTDHVDWGFRVAAVYGLDYRYMIELGLWSDQLWKRNNYYGFDMPMIYGNLYIPNIFEGFNLTFGRIISEADIEAQLAPNNLMSTHSLLYGFDPYTQVGIFTSTKLNDQWIFQAGLANGNDVALWSHDPGNQPTGTLMLQYQSKNGKFGFYGGANGFNNAQFGFNNIQQYVGTLTYKFNEKWWVSHESWYMYQLHATTHPTAEVPLQNGSFPVKPGYAPEWATVNYLMRRLGPSTFLTIRNEVFDDVVGNRTGYNTIYSEHSLGITWWPDKLITFRPEIRYDHSYAMQAYDNGTRRNQFMASFDVIFKF